MTKKNAVLKNQKAGIKNRISTLLLILLFIGSSAYESNGGNTPNCLGNSEPSKIFNYPQKVATYSCTLLVDADGDEVPDATDLDDDNDGILDIDENTCFKLMSPMLVN